MMDSSQAAILSPNLARGETWLPPSAVNVGMGERLLSLAAGVGLLATGFQKRSPWGVLMAVGGGYLMYRANSGHSSLYERMGVEGGAEPRQILKQQVTVQCSRDEAYRFWKDFEQLPTFMQHLARVTATCPGQSHWVAKMPGNIEVSWDAEVIEDRQGELIAWRSLPGSEIETAGEVRFLDAPGDRGTEVHARIEYRAPGGMIGQSAAAILHGMNSQLMKEDMRRFKQLLETGEIPTTEGQPSGREEPRLRTQYICLEQPTAMIVEPRSESTDEVAESSAESFPASDSPGWTSTSATSPTEKSQDMRSSH